MAAGGVALTAAAAGLVIRDLNKSAGALKKGQAVPIFELSDDRGRLVDMAQYLGHKPIVLFFYPAAGSFGCTKEVCEFKNVYEELKDAGAVVLGISRDAKEDNADFRAAHELPFRLLSDTDGKIHELFGVHKILGLIAQRKTFVIDSTGRIAGCYKANFNFTQHADWALHEVQKLQQLREAEKASTFN